MAKSCIKAFALWHYGLRNSFLFSSLRYSSSCTPPVGSRDLQTPNDSAETKFGGKSSTEEDINERNRKYPRRVCLAIAQFFLRTRYKPGQHLSPEDQKFMEEHIIAYHPRKEQKIGVGISKIKVGHMFQNDMWSVCFFVERVDGTEEDFSYKKTSYQLLKQQEPRDIDPCALESTGIEDSRDDNSKGRNNVREEKRVIDRQVLESLGTDEAPGVHRPNLLGREGTLIGENGKGYLVKVCGVI